MDRIKIGYPAGYLRFFESGLDLNIYFWKKIGSGQDQDIRLMAITKFPWEWFKMSKMIVVVFFCYGVSYSQKNQNYFFSMCCAHHNQW